MTAARKPPHVRKLRAIGACEEIIQYAATKPTWTEAWNDCDQPDWLLWLIGKTLRDDPTTPERRAFAGLVAKIARRSLKYAGEYRSQIEPIIKAMERWAKGDPAMPLELLSAALSARPAARSAELSARSAARSAAWSAAEAELSARSAAREAARSAACSAAEAELSAAEAELSAAEAELSARSAAREAARSAAWSAERKFQCKLIRMSYPMPEFPKVRR